MTPFEALCERLNVKKGSKYEIAVSRMVNDLIFDETRTYTDDEINRLVAERFKKRFPYI